MQNFSIGTPNIKKYHKTETEWNLKSVINIKILI